MKILKSSINKKHQEKQNKNGHRIFRKNERNTKNFIAKMNTFNFWAKNGKKCIYFA